MFIERGLMTKIILSRKGFDSGCGGYPSPILPDGTMVSMPIPAFNEEVSPTYADLKCGDISYLNLMMQLGMKKYNESSKVHLDPDINYSVVERKEKTWQPIFGQCDIATSHLDINEVGKGDIFLFFGLFRNTIKTDTGYKFDRKASEKHVLWGYMEVGDVVKIEKEANYPEHYLGHPHFQDRNRGNNTAYIATDKLSFNLKRSGAGVFKFDESLVLSCDPKYKTIWKLPKFFHPDNGVQMTYHPNMNRWQMQEDCCILKSVCRGQEFIVSENSDVTNWAKEIILNNTNEKSLHV